MSGKALREGSGSFDTKELSWAQTGNRAEEKRMLETFGANYNEGALLLTQ